MDLASPAVLGSLAAHSFAFLLILARVGSVCMLTPVIGEAETPATVRAGLCLALSFLLLPPIEATLPRMPSQPWTVAGLLVAEIVAGLLIGWLARLACAALAFAGQLAALATGLASVIQPDPALGAQSAALGRFMSIAAPVVLLASGLYRLPLLSLAGSYDVIVPGHILPAADSVEVALRAVGTLMRLAASLAAPFTLASLVGHVAVAVVSRLVPTLQLFGLAAPLQVFVGFMLLAALAAGVLAIWQNQAAAILGALPGL